VNSLQYPAQSDISEKDQRRQYYKYAAINFAFYITLTFNGYVNVFLQSIGFNPQQVGMITALNSGVGIFSSPFWGMLSDKIRSLKKVITVALTVGAILFFLIPWLSGMYIGWIPLLFLLIPISMFFRTPVMSLIDNWTLRNARTQKLNYGALRAYGALSFALASLALGYIIPRTGVEFIFLAGVIFTVPPLLLVVFIKDNANKQDTKNKNLTFKEMNIGQLFKNYYLVAYIIFSIFLRIPFQSSMIFLPFLIADVGGDISQLGIAMGLRALAEIPSMLLLKPLRQKFPLYIMIIGATGIFVVECMLYSVATSFSMIVAIAMLNGIGNGMIIPAGSSYVFSLAPEHLKATTQTILASTNAIAGIIGGLLGGLLIMLFDIKQFYFIISIMLSIALIVFALSFFVGEKILGIKRPGLSLN